MKKGMLFKTAKIDGNTYPIASNYHIFPIAQ